MLEFVLLFAFLVLFFFLLLFLVLLQFEFIALLFVLGFDFEFESVDFLAFEPAVLVEINDPEIRAERENLAKAIPFFGVGLATLSFLALVALTVQALFFGVPFPGFGTIVALSLLFAGFLFLLLGVVSEYVGMIFDETRGRPLFIEREALGFNDEP